MKKLLGIAAIAFFIPLLVFAQNSTGFQGVQVFTNFENLIQTIGNIISDLVPILVTLAIVVFFIGLIQYIFKPDDKEKSKKTMFAGIVSIFIMVSLWGIITLMQNVFGISNTATQSAPVLGGYSTNNNPPNNPGTIRGPLP